MIVSTIVVNIFCSFNLKLFTFTFISNRKQWFYFIIEFVAFNPTQMIIFLSLMSCEVLTKHFIWNKDINLILLNNLVNIHDTSMSSQDNIKLIIILFPIFTRILKFGDWVNKQKIP